jgi:thiamine biosynthesis lipoprotein
MSRIRVPHLGPWLLAGLALLAACKREEPVFNTRFPGFDTQVDLSIIGVDRDTATRAARALEQDFELMRQSWHPWKPGTLRDVNRALHSGEAIFLPPSLTPLLQLGERYTRLSGGLLNPAMGRLTALWGFHAEVPECRPPPPQAAIDAWLKAAPRLSDLQWDGFTVRSRNPELQLDFSAFAKGYGIDQAIAHLRELGIHNATINVGGDLRAIGDRDGQPWRTTLRRPNGGVFAVVDISGDESLFTADAYEHNFVYEGVNYPHHLDPRNGRPVQGTQAVIVLHGDAATADAASQALMVAGIENWTTVARTMEVRQVLLLDEAGTLHLTPAMAERVRFLDQDPDLRLSEAW